MTQIFDTCFAIVFLKEAIWVPPQYEKVLRFQQIQGRWQLKNGDISNRYGSMNSHTDLQHNGLESLMNDIARIDTDMKET